MKRIKLLLLVFSLLTIGLLSESCKKDESCPTINCNTGTLNEETCACDCPDGYTGDNCGSFDASQVQALLANHTPIELVNNGVPIDSLYGKMYEGGIIFYLNTADGTGMVAAIENQSDFAKWGCPGTDIMGLENVPGNAGVPEGSGAEIGDGSANTDAILAGCMPNDGTAAKLCRELGADWFLPSIKELNLMYTNLHDKGHGGFAANWYWSSTEFDGSNVWSRDFINGFQEVVSKGSNDYPVRAARAF